MTPQEWENLCDGCGICCLNKVQDEDTDEYFYTDVACSLLDIETCRCRDYENRGRVMSDCRKLSPEMVRKIPWLPATCAYRLITEGKELEWWHPLVSGDPETVRLAGISPHGRIVSEKNVHPDHLADHVIDWIIV